MLRHFMVTDLVVEAGTPGHADLSFRTWLADSGVMSLTTRHVPGPVVPEVGGMAAGHWRYPAPACVRSRPHKWGRGFRGGRAVIAGLRCWWCSLLRRAAMLLGTSALVRVQRHARAARHASHHVNHVAAPVCCPHAQVYDLMDQVIYGAFSIPVVVPTTQTLTQFCCTMRPALAH